MFSECVAIRPSWPKSAGCARARLLPRRRTFSLQGIPPSHNRLPPPLGWFAILTPVFVLYSVYVACTVALVGAAAGIARHIVQHRRGVRSHAEHPDEHL